jgi:uncharacterized protein YjbJ (UPF0337 family)
MRRDRIEGKMKVAEGKVLRGVGKVSGSRKTQAKGIVREAQGRLQSAKGKALERLDRDKDRVRARSARPRPAIRKKTTTVTTVKVRR